jgi:16S rRNA processing protein RimM
MIEVAKIGKSVGLNGSQKLYLTGDFPEQLQNGKSFQSSKRSTLTIDSYDPEKELVKFQGIDTPEAAKKLTNQKLYTTMEATRDECVLEKDEFFWFDIIGCRIVEENKVLGVVTSIEAIGPTDYFIVKTDQKLIDAGLSATFYLPYIDPYIDRVEMSDRTIYSQNAMSIIENS